jgi:hypothetical protein
MSKEDRPADRNGIGPTFTLHQSAVGMRASSVRQGKRVFSGNALKSASLDAAAIRRAGQSPFCSIKRAVTLGGPMSSLVGLCLTIAAPEPDMTALVKLDGRLRPGGDKARMSKDRSPTAIGSAATDGFPTPIRVRACLGRPMRLLAEASRRAGAWDANFSIDASPGLKTVS